MREARTRHAFSILLAGALAVAGDVRADPQLVKAFAFGARSLTCQTITDPAREYTMVLHRSQDDPSGLEYDPARGWGYEAVHSDYASDPSTPYGNRSGFEVFGPFDKTPNFRTAFPDTCPEELFDSFIGGWSYLTACNESVAGDRNKPCPQPEGIIFRVDVPNGTYRFVAAVGDAQFLHAHMLLAENGGSGPPEAIGSDHVALVRNFNQPDYTSRAYAWVGFDTFSAPAISGAQFVSIGSDGYPSAGPAASPALEVTEGYIRIHQLQGNLNPGPGGAGDARGGGDLVILELWLLSTDAPAFTRGDANADGKTDISDGISVLLFLFIPGATASCEDALDANDDGSIGVADAVYLLTHLFAGGPRPLPPCEAAGRPLCGYDTTNDGLTCDSFAPCG